MALVIVGIDEAGYGPTLGPLCVGLAALRVEDVPQDRRAPDLWERLSAGVCRKPGARGKPDALGRVAIADSKVLKLSNSAKTVDPLVHLERGVLSFGRAAWGVVPETDADLAGMLGASHGPQEWYAGEPLALPVALGKGEAALSASMVERALGGAGVGVAAIGCHVMDEGSFNDAAREGGKAETTARAFCLHMRRAWERWPGGESDGADKLAVVCDRHGGRTSYTPLIRRALGDGVEVTTIEEHDSRSSYVVRATDGTGKRAGVMFTTEGEAAHLPIALASMIAKYVRELSMRRFNRYWTARAAAAGCELKPTAGYAMDARRWLRDTRRFLREGERRALERIA